MYTLRHPSIFKLGKYPVLTKAYGDASGVTDINGQIDCDLSIVGNIIWLEKDIQFAPADNQIHFYEYDNITKKLTAYALNLTNNTVVLRVAEQIDVPIFVDGYIP